MPSVCHLCDGYKPGREVKAISPWLRHLAGAWITVGSGVKKTASATPPPFFPRWSNFGQQIVSGQPIISVELKNVLDGSALKSLFDMRLKPNSFVEFTQTLEKKIIPLFRIQKGFQGEIMLCYAIFDLYQTRFSLLMEDFAVVVFGAVAVVLLSVFAVWMLTTVLSIILLPIYLLGVLRSAIEASGNSEDCAVLAKASLEGEQARGARRRALSRPRFGATFLRHLVNSPREMQGREV